MARSAAQRGQGAPLAPGARVVVRNEEWSVRAVRGAGAGGDAVHVVGVSELVRGKEAIFLTALDPVRALRPEETELVLDTTPRFRRSRLYLESLLRRSPPTDAGLYVGHRAALRLARYQCDPAAKALGMLRPRILMADGVGLGKTIEVGILLSELIRRGQADRILVVTLKSILGQFQRELWSRFTIPLVRLDSVGIQRVQSKIPSSMNPFWHFDRVIISIDTLKKDEKYRRYLENCRFDAIVIDECQNVAVRDQGLGKSRRASLAELLARISDTLILTSATPHDGRPESFASLLNLLEPTTIADPTNYTRDEVGDLVVRRFKKDVAAELDSGFRERRLSLRKLDASPAENEVFAKLAAASFRTVGKERAGAGMLFKTLLLKAFLSSPAALEESLAERRAKKAVQAESDAAAHDRAVLSELETAVAAVSPQAFTKFQALVRALRELGYADPKSAPRVVLFSERIATLRFLDRALRHEFPGLEGHVAIFHGALDDTEQQELVRTFGTKTSPLRLLLASDVASEGINLHYFCHRLIHFDLPWSLITLEQRNGRIDRFGQEEEPQISYLLTVPADPALRGDLRVLERLIEKEDAAQKNLGDVAWLLDLHDAAREEEHIARGIENHEDPGATIPDIPAGRDLIELFFGTAPAAPSRVDLATPLRLYRDDLAYAKEAFAEILGDETSAALRWHDTPPGFSLVPPEDLARRFETLPPELRADSGELRLTADRERVMRSLADAQENDLRFPDWQLFWELHPVSTWLDDRVLAAFARHEAPVLRLAGGLQRDEAVLLFQGVVSNHRSRPVIVEWFGVPFVLGQARPIRPLAELLAATGLGDAPPNPARELGDRERTALALLVPTAVPIARRHLQELRKARAAAIAEPLREGLRRLQRWHDKAVARLTDDGPAGKNDRGLSPLERRRRDEQRRHRDAVLAERKAWIEDGMRTVDEPFLRLAAVLIPGGS